VYLPADRIGYRLNYAKGGAGGGGYAGGGAGGVAYFRHTGGASSVDAGIIGAGGGGSSYLSPLAVGTVTAGGSPAENDSSDRAAGGAVILTWECPTQNR